MFYLCELRLRIYSHKSLNKLLNKQELILWFGNCLMTEAVTLGAAQAAGASTRTDSTTAHGRGNVITGKDTVGELSGTTRNLISRG
jgi:hypothetical protein